MSEVPLAIRGLSAFADPMPEQLTKLLDVYRTASRAALTATTERITLEKELRDLEQDDSVDAGTVLAALHRRREIHQELETLGRILVDASAREEMAVVVAEAARAAGAMFKAAGLTASSTFAAHMAGIQEGIERVDEPLPAEHTARLRENYRARRGLG